MIGVCTSIPAYRVAVAELPSSVKLVPNVADSITVVPGDRRWAQSARSAFEGGAAAVIVANPGFVDPDECLRLHDAAGRRPIVVDRPMLRADLVETASAHASSPSYAAVDVAAMAGRRSEAVRDAAGWIRVLLGGPCEVREAGRTGSAVLALLQCADDGAPGALTATTIEGADEGPWIRVLAVAATRIEVAIDEADAQMTVEVTTAEGVLRTPRPFETHERLSLRRALHALSAGGQPVTDLAELRADDAVAEGLLGGRR
ncbi:hypothetical protein [Microbacterium aerolatum]|uniref:Gfo/Idh/MocA-like oxidoreductase N-terminal domain-containing protein n=1 Tax=Microbacterium aerolatum TaxID=153731 RepID=A0A511AGW0_9MICO|nr:hypothetical protein [Microbacterium aerolatum]GEK87404.1 hypothetical protein MAE01_25800 [Microbacterium aerolatum]GGB33294.1 hypothetical protein GCM10007198_24760 [Microbacterium aerolatum]